MPPWLSDRLDDVVKLWMQRRDAASSVAPGGAETRAGRDHADSCVALGSGNPNDLALIGTPSIALATWWRPNPLLTCMEDLVQAAPLQVESDVLSVARDLELGLAVGGARDWHASLVADAVMLASRFALLARCAAVSVSVETQPANGKPMAPSSALGLRVAYFGNAIEWTIVSDPDPVVHEVALGHVLLVKRSARQPPGIACRHGLNPSRRPSLLLTIDAKA